jgi:hypothetical protein
MKLKSATPKMNADCIIQRAVIALRFFNGVGLIDGNELRARIDEVLSCSGFGHRLRRSARRRDRLRLQQ